MAQWYTTRMDLQRKVWVALTPTPLETEDCWIEYSKLRLLSEWITYIHEGTPKQPEGFGNFSLCRALIKA